MKFSQVIFVSLISGFLGAFLFSKAQSSKTNIELHQNAQTLTVSSINLVDAAGKLRAQLALSAEKTPGLWFYDEKGTVRESMGLYADGTSYFGLADAQGAMIQLMRSFGPNEAPLLIFKNRGQDMMITGLNPGSETVPFLMSYDSGRTKNVHFGKYEGP